MSTINNEDPLLGQFPQSMTRGLLGSALVYLSGPITGKPNENAEAFQAAEDALTLVGFRCVNPVTLGRALKEKHVALGWPWRPPTYADYMRKDYAELVKCQAILMLRGWQQSNGAKRELQVACDIGIPIYFQ